MKPVKMCLLDFLKVYLYRGYKMSPGCRERRGRILPTQEAAYRARRINKVFLGHS